MARPRYQDGSMFIRGKRNKVWVARWREDLIREDGSLHRTQRTVVLGSLTDLSRREAARSYRSESLKSTRADIVPDLS